MKLRWYWQYSEWNKNLWREDSSHKWWFLEVCNLQGGKNLKLQLPIKYCENTRWNKNLIKYTLREKSGRRKEKPYLKRRANRFLFWEKEVLDWNLIQNMIYSNSLPHDLRRVKLNRYIDISRSASSESIYTKGFPRTILSEPNLDNHEPQQKYQSREKNVCVNVSGLTITKSRWKPWQCAREWQMKPSEPKIWIHQNIIIENGSSRWKVFTHKE